MKQNEQEGMTTKSLFLFPPKAAPNPLFPLTNTDGRGKIGNKTTSYAAE